MAEERDRLIEALRQIQRECRIGRKEGDRSLYLTWINRIAERAIRAVSKRAVLAQEKGADGEPPV